MERTNRPRGMRPRVSVQHESGDPPSSEMGSMLVFLAMDLEDGLVREIDRAVRARFQLWSEEEVE